MWELPKSVCRSLQGLAARAHEEDLLLLLAALRGWRAGSPDSNSLTKGPEFVSRALDAWAHAYNVKLEYSRPGKPTDNPDIEDFNGRLRVECLNQHWFEALSEARQEIESR